jgi:hypothetical protein
MPIKAFNDTYINGLSIAAPMGAKKYLAKR